MQNLVNIKPRPLAIAVAVAMGTAPAASMAAAGRIQFAFGQVTVEQDGGATAPLKRGDKVDAGDTIVTEKGRAQIKFTDGSKISLQPQSSFKINEYKYDTAGRDSGGSRNFMSLFRGGLRAISGAIGRSNRNSYRLTTPVGTIGIRGTEYLIMLDGSGAIVTVGDGAVALLNDAGEVVLVNGQTGRIVSKDSLPVIVNGKAVVPPPPKDVKDDPETGEPEQDDDEFQITVSNDNGDQGNAVDDLTEGDLPGMMGEMMMPVEEEEEGEPVVGEPIPTALESGSGFAVAYSFQSGPSPAIVAEKVTDVDATFVGAGLTNFTDGMTTSDIGDLVLAEEGSDQFIGWGRWTHPSAFPTVANFTVDDLNKSFDEENQSVHYVTGRPTDLALLAGEGQTNANYSILSFTSPTDHRQNIGTLDQAQTRFQVDFAAQTVDLSVGLTIDGDDYDFVTDSVGAPGGTFRETGISVNSGSSCGSAGCSADVSGLVAGPNADRAGFVYGIEDNDAFRAVNGAVTFFRDAGGPPVLIPD